MYNVYIYIYYVYIVRHYLEDLQFRKPKGSMYSRIANEVLVRLVWSSEGF